MFRIGYKSVNYVNKSPINSLLLPAVSQLLMNAYSSGVLNTKLVNETKIKMATVVKNIESMYSLTELASCKRYKVSETKDMLD